MSTLYVLCWYVEHFSDDAMHGYGYTVHKSQEEADVWRKDSSRVPSKLHHELLICGAGYIKRPNEDHVSRLSQDDGLFLRSMPEGFILTSGKTPQMIDAEQKEIVDRCLCEIPD